MRGAPTELKDDAAIQECPGGSGTDARREAAITVAGRVQIDGMGRTRFAAFPLPLALLLSRERDRDGEIITETSRR